LNVPPTIYRYEIATQKSTVSRQPKVPVYNANAFETKQSSTPARMDRVPMFLVYRKELKLDGNNPTMLFGYGGFSIATYTTFNAPVP